MYLFPYCMFVNQACTCLHRKFRVVHRLSCCSRLKSLKNLIRQKLYSHLEKRKFLLFNTKIWRLTAKKPYIPFGPKWGTHRAGQKLRSGKKSNFGDTRTHLYFLLLFEVFPEIVFFVFQ